MQTTGKACSHLDYYKSVKRFCNWMVEEDILPVSPMTKIKAPRIPEPIIRPLTEDHIETLLEICPAETFIGSRNRAMFLVFLQTGLRLSELAAIMLDDVNVEEMTITVMGKGAKERKVALSRTTLKAMVHYLSMRDDKYKCLWVSISRKPMTVDGIGQIFKKTLKERSGITDVRVSAHTIRHTFATMLLTNGAAEGSLQTLLGHSTQKMTRHYTATVRQQVALDAGRKFSPVEYLQKGHQKRGV